MIASFIAIKSLPLIHTGKHDSVDATIVVNS